MTAREAHKAQWQALKDKPFKDKLTYIFTYYWAAILGVVCVIAFGASWIIGVLSQKDIALSGYLLNSLTDSSYAGNLPREFMAHQQIDSDIYDFRLTTDTAYSHSELSDTSIAVLESIVVQAATGELDFIVADLETYPTLSAYFTDLGTVLTQEQLEKWGDNLVYVEKEALERLTSDNFEEFEIPQYYLTDEGLTNPVPLGIRLPDSCRLLDAYVFPQGNVIFGIAYNAKNTENALAFLEYIF